MTLAEPLIIDRPSDNRSQDERLAPLVAAALDKLGAGDMDEAIGIIGDIEAIAPGDAVALHLVGLASFRLEEPGKALAAFEGAQKAVPSVKEHAEAMSVVCAKLGKIPDSLFYAKLSIAAPDSARFPGLLPEWFGKFEDSFFAMSDDSALRRAERAVARADWPVASELYRKATEIDPQSVTAWRGLVDSLCEQERADDALAALGDLRKLQPDDPTDFPRYARAFELAGFWNEAGTAADLAAASLENEPVVVWQSVRIALNRPDALRADAAELMANWGRKFGAVQEQSETPAPEIPMAKRRLRLGVFSSHWLEGEGLDFIVPLLAALPRRSVELHVYADGVANTALATKARGIAGEWHEIGDLDDETIAFMLANDALDALIDLDGPLRRRRHALFATHPVPLALSWLDLPEACGPCGFDAAIGDGNPAEDGGTLLSLPGVITLPKDKEFLAEIPTDDAASTRPAVFGSLRARREITSRTTALWSRILQEVPGATLRLMHDRIGGAAGAQHLAKLFPADLLPRIEIADAATMTRDYLTSIDLLLDPVDSSQPEESVAAACCGIPVVTLPGSFPAQQVLGGWLQRQNFPELVASDDDSYIAAARAASDPNGNASLRARLCDAAKQEAEHGAAMRAKALEDGIRALIDAREVPQ